MAHWGASMTVLADPHYLELVWRGFLTTLALSAAVIVASNLLAYALAVHLLRPLARLRRTIIAYSLFSRAVPVLALLFVVYYGLPRVGIYLEPVAAALIGLIFSSTAYNLEFLRSGFEAVKPSQLEAARALGLGHRATVWKVMTPQAYALAAPALFSNAIQIVKGSSLASLVSIAELTAASTTIIAESYRAIEVLVVVAALYMAICAVIIGLQHLYERHRGWSPL
jgi:His/Glu/Gln/Arg/opine family amino acid ABC transporter permease subunit